MSGLIHTDNCAGWADPNMDFDGCDCVVAEVAGLRAQLATAEAERDRYLTRACVAEAKVARVTEVATEQTLVDTEGSGMIPATWAHARGRSHMAHDILTAIGGKP